MTFVFVLATWTNFRYCCSLGHHESRDHTCCISDVPLLDFESSSRSRMGKWGSRNCSHHRTDLPPSHHAQCRLPNHSTGRKRRIVSPSWRRDLGGRDQAAAWIQAVDDFPSKSCIFPGPRGWNSELNVVSGIKNTTTILLDYVEGKETGGRAEEALKFFIHFLGDMHQPFTCREGQSAETRLKLRSVAKRPVRLEPLFSKC